MIVHGVSFFEKEVRIWKKCKFIDAHKKVFFLNMEMTEREKILEDIWNKSKSDKIE